MSKGKFPLLIHVTHEETPGEDPFLIVREGGAVDTAFDETTPCAVYKRVSVGKVEVTRKFVLNHFHDRKK